MKIRHDEGKKRVGVHPAKYNVTKTNDGIDRLLAVTTNPRHRFMLQAYYRH